MAMALTRAFVFVRVCLINQNSAHHGHIVAIISTFIDSKFAAPGHRHHGQIQILPFIVVVRADFAADTQSLLLIMPNKFTGQASGFGPIPPAVCTKIASNGGNL